MILRPRRRDRAFLTTFHSAWRMTPASHLFRLVLCSAFFGLVFLACPAPNDGQVIRELLRDQAQLHGSYLPTYPAKRTLKDYQNTVFSFHPGRSDEVSRDIEAALLGGGFVNKEALSAKNSTSYWRCYFAAQNVDLDLFHSACGAFLGDEAQVKKHQLAIYALLRQQAIHKGVDVTADLELAAKKCQLGGSSCLMLKWMHHEALQERQNVDDSELRRNANLLGAIRSSHRFGPFSSMQALSFVSTASGQLVPHQGAVPRFSDVARRQRPLLRFHFSSGEKKGWVIVPKGTLVFLNGKPVTTPLRLNEYRAFHFESDLTLSDFDVVTNGEKVQGGAFFILNESLEAASTRNASSLQELDYKMLPPHRPRKKEPSVKVDIATLLAQLSIESLGFGEYPAKDALEMWMHALRSAPRSQPIQEALGYALDDKSRFSWPEKIRSRWKEKLAAVSQGSHDEDVLSSSEAQENAGLHPGRFMTESSAAGRHKGDDDVRETMQDQKAWRSLKKRLQNDFPIPLSQNSGEGAFLRFEEEVHTYPGGDVFLLTGFSAQLRTRKALERIEKIAADWNASNLLLAEGVTAQGEGFQLERNAEGDIRFAGLELGMVVRFLRVTSFDLSPHRPRRFFVPLPLACFDRRISVVRHFDRTSSTSPPVSLYVLDKDENGERFLEELSYQKSVERNTLRSRAATFSRRNVDKAAREPFSPVDDRDLAHLVLLKRGGNDRDLWTERAPLIHDDWAKSLLLELDVSGNNEEKLSRIYRFVTEEIVSSSQPRSPRSIFLSGQGYRESLFEKLLHAAGLTPRSFDLVIPSNIKSRSFWPQPSVRVLELPPIPWQGQFNSIYASVVEDFTFIGEPPSRLRGSVDENGVSFSAPGYRDHSFSVDLELQPTVGSSATLEGVLWLRIPAIDADAFRASIGTAGKNEMQKDFTALLHKQLNGLQIEDFKIFNLKNRGTNFALRMRLKWTLPLPRESKSMGAFFSQGTGAAFGLSASWKDISKLVGRERDLRVDAASATLNVRIALPSGPYAFSQVPRSLHDQTGSFEILQNVEVSDGVLHIQRIERVRSIEISPRDWTKQQPGLARLVSKMPLSVTISRGTPGP